MIHLEVEPPPGGSDLIHDFNEDASHIGQGASPCEQQQLAQTMESICSTPSTTTSSIKFPATGRVFRKESDNVNTLRGRTSTSYPRGSSAKDIFDEEESIEDE